MYDQSVEKKNVKRLREYITQKQVDLLFLSETWQRKDQPLPILPGYGLISCMSDPAGGRGGVACYFKQNFEPYISLYKTDPSGHYFWLKLDNAIGLENDLYVAVCYYPPKSSTAYKGRNKLDEGFPFGNLKKDITDFRKNESTNDFTVVGDFNSRVGDAQTPEAFRHGLSRESADKKTNQFCSSLLDICTANDLIICNGVTQVWPKSGETTCRNRSVIDYILAPVSRARYLVRDIDILPLEKKSDHNAINFTLRRPRDLQAKIPPGYALKIPDEQRNLAQIGDEARNQNLKLLTEVFKRHQAPGESDKPNSGFKNLQVGNLLNGDLKRSTSPVKLETTPAGCAYPNRVDYSIPPSTTGVQNQYDAINAIPFEDMSWSELLSHYKYGRTTLPEPERSVGSEERERDVPKEVTIVLETGEELVRSREDSANLDGPVSSPTVPLVKSNIEDTSDQSSAEAPHYRPESGPAAWVEAKTSRLLNRILADGLGPNRHQKAEGIPGHPSFWSDKKGFKTTCRDCASLSHRPVSLAIPLLDKPLDDGIRAKESCTYRYDSKGDHLSIFQLQSYSGRGPSKLAHGTLSELRNWRKLNIAASYDLPLSFSYERASTILSFRPVIQTSPRAEAVRFYERSDICQGVIVDGPSLNTHNLWASMVRPQISAWSRPTRKDQVGGGRVDHPLKSNNTGAMAIFADAASSPSMFRNLKSRLMPGRLCFQKSMIQLKIGQKLVRAIL